MAWRKEINERGFTLMELLIVVVILGIIAAISVPSVGGLINNARADAHIANAQQMINAAKLYVVAYPLETNNERMVIYLSKNTAPAATQDSDRLLVENGYLEELENPFTNEPYDCPGEGCFVEVTNNNGQYIYKVTLDPGAQYREYNIDGLQLNELNRETIKQKNNVTP